MNEVKVSKRKFSLIPYLYIAPAVSLLLIFIYWPLVYSILLSLFQWDFVSPVKNYVGAKNYRQLFIRDDFFISITNTFKYLLGLVPIELFFSLGIALLISNVRSSKLRNFYRVILFMPSILSFGIVCFVWLWIFNPIGGILNEFLNLFHIKGTAWLSDERWALRSVMMVAAWKVFGYNMVIYLSALSSVPVEYIEAAKIDGTSPFKIFLKIQWPLISPSTFFILITTVIFASAHVFIPIHILTEGGPGNQSLNLIFLVYAYAFKYFNIGMASAISVLVFILFLFLTLLQIRYLERFVHYEI